MKRRDFIAALGGAAAWPVVARAQQSDRVRLLAYLRGASESIPTERERFETLVAKLDQLGWTVGRNLRIEKRFADGDEGKMRSLAKELVLMRPDVIQVAPSPAGAAVFAETKTIPIVFTIVADPVGVGFVSSLARPGENITGFTLYEHGISSKWLGLLKEIAPKIRRAVIMHSPAGFAMESYIAPIETAAREIGIFSTTVVVGNEAQIDAAIDAIGREGEAGLIVLPDTYTTTHGRTVLSAVARNKVPAIYPAVEYWAKAGGLISYGSDLLAMTNGAAGYIDRILRGEKPGDLPVQQPNRYVLAINLKTAKALGLDIPPQLLARADEVIE
jgi:putative tryptophan/tyrosine transport system substrate-binding protein